MKQANMSNPKVMDDEDIETAMLYPQGTATAVNIQQNNNVISSRTWKRIIGVGVIAFVGFVSVSGFCKHHQHRFFLGPFGRHHHHHPGHWNHHGHHHGHRPDEMMMEQHDGFSGDMMMYHHHHHKYNPHLDHHGMKPHHKPQWKGRHHHHSFSESSSSDSSDEGEEPFMMIEPSSSDSSDEDYDEPQSSSSSSDSSDEDEEEPYIMVETSRSSSSDEEEPYIMIETSSSDSSDEAEIMIDPIPEIDEDPEFFEDNFESAEEPYMYDGFTTNTEDENIDIFEELENEMTQSEEKVSRMEGPP
jgi:hypothetical protein